jgi:hypothetical protein
MNSGFSWPVSSRNIAVGIVFMMICRGRKRLSTRVIATQIDFLSTLRWASIANHVMVGLSAVISAASENTLKQRISLFTFLSGDA